MTAILGLASASVCGFLYALVLMLSVYEYVAAPNGFPVVGYVRHGIAAGVFVVICLVAARGCWIGRFYGQALAAIAPLMLIVFVFPGLNEVWGFVTGLGW